MRIYPPYNLLTAAYAIGFVRFVLWWRRSGLATSRTLDPRLHQFILWHAWPVLLSFLLPGHIKDFFSYLTRHHGETKPRTNPLLGGLPFYGESLLADYHIGPWSLGIALALAAIAFLSLAKGPALRSALAFCIFLIAGALTVYHPSHRSRFLHSWIAVVWVLAGMGFAQLVTVQLADPKEVARPRAGRLPDELPGSGSNSPDARPRPCPEACPAVPGASLLDVTDAYLPSLANSRRVTILSSVPLIRFLADWTFMERFGRHRLETHWFGFGPAGAELRTLPSGS